MTLEVLQQDMYKAMKSGDKLRKSVLSSVISEIKKNAIDNGQKNNITEELVNQTLLKEKKMLQEAYDSCSDAIIRYKHECFAKILVLDEYCPKLLDNPIEIKNQILDICTNNYLELDIKNKGQIMKTIMPKFKGKADMKIVNQVINQFLKGE